MAYQALYRVWRSQTFEDVVGQKHVTQTLQNAIANNKVSHAYLFSGPRGTGKTSAARIFAKAINCENFENKEPCNKCPMCISITSGTLPDVIEIDAASNNGVEEIRELRDKINYVPVAARNKVYIIDEVHMLSIGAFNALLKTLEEPPKHAVFILATTEPHKIPLTIHSRCQRYDFRQITVEDTISRMKFIMQEIGVAYENAALEVIARAAGGGMRDALSLLDQAISFCENTVTELDALEITGTVSRNNLFEITKSISEGELVSALDLLGEVIDRGKDPQRFAEELVFYYRDLLLEKASGATSDNSYSESVSSPQLCHYIEEWNKAVQEMKWVSNRKVFLEVVVVKLVNWKSEQILELDKKEFADLKEKLYNVELELEELKKMQLSSPLKKEDKAQSNNILSSTKNKEISDVLIRATKLDKEKILNIWQEMKTLCFGDSQPHMALLNESEPVAAAKTSFVLKFKHDIHCQMFRKYPDVLRKILDFLKQKIGIDYDVLVVSEKTWLEERKNFLARKKKDNQDKLKSEPLHVKKAKELFGETLVEVIK